MRYVMETVKELLIRLVNRQGEYKVGDLIKFVGVVTGQDLSVKSIQFKVEDKALGSLEISTKTVGRYCCTYTTWVQKMVRLV